MKLHLPKLLRVAVLAALSFTYVAPVVAESINLSTVQITDNTYTHTEESLTLGTDERMGLKDGDTWKKIADKDAKNKQNYTSIFTPNVVVSKELKLTSNSRVDVGGVGTSSSLYTGITADTISVQNTAELYTYKVNVRELNVSGGTVQIHYEENGTSATYGPYGDSGTNGASKKQAHIKESLTVSGGAVKIGSSQSEEILWSGIKHIQTVFGQGSTTGGATITQKGGTLDIQGKTATVGNFSIEQSGGTMNVVTKSGSLANGSKLFLASGSTNTIRQSGTAEGMTMSIGLIKGYSAGNSPSKATLHIKQESQSGTISLSKGVYFGSGSPNSSISLTGGGSVSLTGDYSGAVFDVSLEKGTLSLEDGNTKLKSSEIGIAAGAKIKNAGTIQVGTVTAGTTKSGGLYVTSGGTFGVLLDKPVATTSSSEEGATTKTPIFTVGSGCDFTEWKMESDSYFGIGVTEDHLKDLIDNTDNTTIGSNKTITFELDDVEQLLVAKGAVSDIPLDDLDFAVVGLDRRLWSLEAGNTKLTLSDSKDELYVTVDGAELIFDSVIDITTGGTVIESFSDVSGNKQTLKVGLAVSSNDVILSGDNKHSGGTSIDGVTVTLGHANALGTGEVVMQNHATLNLGGYAIANAIKVEGCTLAGAGAYSGIMDVSGDLLLQDATTAAKVVMTGAGKISGAPLTTDALDVQTDGNASIGGELTINDNGTITLSNGSLLVVGGSLTLGNGAKLVLDGDYAAGTSLLSSTGALTMGDVTLVYGDTTVELELQGNSLMLVSKFKQNKATASTLSNWGIATASRAVVNAVRGQRSNTGCIANGKGTAWVASLGSKHEINGSDIDISGAAVGADMKVGRNSRIGIALGYAEGEVQPAGFSQVDQEGSYIAAYGEHGLKKLSSTSCLSMDWVAAYGTTDSEVGGLKWEQDSLQLNSRVNWNKKVNNRLCMSVFGGLEYFANNSDTVDGVKTGSIQNLRGEIGVGARYVAWGTPAVTDGKSGLVLAKGCEKLVLNGEVRYMNDMVRSNPVVRMNGLSGTGNYNPGRQGIGIEAGATYRIGERWSASANYGFNTMDDSKEHRVNVGASYTF